MGAGKARDVTRPTLMPDTAGREMNVPIISFSERARADRFEIVDVVAGSGGAREGGGEDGFADIGVGAKHLMNAQVFVQKRHQALSGAALAGSAGIDFFVWDPDGERFRRHFDQTQPGMELAMCLGAIQEHRANSCSFCRATQLVARSLVGYQATVCLGEIGARKPSSVPTSVFPLV